MCFTPVLFTKWNDCIFHSKQGQNQDPAFSHMFIGQKIVPAYVFVGQFCLLANLQIFISFIEIIFLPKIYVVNVMFAIHFLKLHAICFQMRPNTTYLVQKFLVWGKAQYCYVKISRLSARQFVPWDHMWLVFRCHFPLNRGYTGIFLHGALVHMDIDIIDKARTLL